MTPLDKLSSLPDAAQFLRVGITLADLHATARSMTDVQAAKKLNAARQALFKRVTARAA